MLPEKFCERMKAVLGPEYEAFEASFEREPFRGLRANALKMNCNGKNAARIFKDLEAETVPVLGQVSWAENGYYYDQETAPGKHPYHEAGVYYIQEPSAMAPVGMLGVQPGERVLDLCAAPGGKSSQLAACLMGEGILISNEIHPQRARILSENMERMGVKNAIVTNENAQHLASCFPGFFDKILVDAPCSGEGMFRKNEDAQVEWSPENVELCAARQDEILEYAAQMLSAGGCLVYSTCTFAEAEDEGSIARFLEHHPEFVLSEQTRLWPHKVQGEGHFAAKLIKGGSAATEKIAPITGYMPGEKYRALKEFCEFAEETFTPKQVEEWTRDGQNSTSGQGQVFSYFGDNLYLMPQGTPVLKGLKIMRPGLALGTFKKNRFEPSHSLALAMDPAACKHVYELGSLEEAKRYLDGMTLNAEGEKGWYLICIHGYSLGWGKLAGGVMKNHYPKGLRK